ncbi:MAG: LacI family DNA-binding transcriptional regulator [Acidobacteriaceae bacterium]|nr:LacI family DNA-binding transcriptional regulator [Acidobacteriaceae bacterium]
MSQDTSKPAGIRQIAVALGISNGTVDRALHARVGVSPKTRDRVLKMAKQLNYSPNVAARNLRLNRHLRVGVFLPAQIASYFGALKEGIQNAAESWSGPGVDLTFYSYPRLGEGDLEAMKAAQWEEFDGVIMAPGSPARMATLVRNPERNTPIVYVSTDAPRTGRLACIAVDSVISGGIAAELLGRMLPSSASVAMFTGDLKIHDHADKLRGFAASLATLAPHLSLVPAVESHERPEEAYKSALKVLRKFPHLGGLYINTANSLPVLRAVEKVNAFGKLQIITTDLFPELAAMIESNKVFATLYQRPFTQGRMAFEMLCRYLTTGAIPKDITRLAPHIILRSNLPLFVDLLAQEELYCPER